MASRVGMRMRIRIKTKQNLMASWVSIEEVYFYKFRQAWKCLEGALMKTH